MSTRSIRRLRRQLAKISNIQYVKPLEQEGARYGYKVRIGATGVIRTIANNDLVIKEIEHYENHSVVWLIYEDFYEDNKVLFDGIKAGGDE